MRAALSGGGTITFACDGTITLTNTLIVERDVVLDGTGHNVVISGNKSVRLFQVNTGVTFTAVALTISDGLHQGLQSSTPRAPGGNGFGAGILNLGGTVTLINCTLSNHVVQGGAGNPDIGGQAKGAALYNLGGTVNLTNCVLAGNLAQGGSEASSVFSGVAGGGYGAALYAEGGGMIISGCTFEKNNSTGGGELYFLGGGTGGPGQGGALYATSCVVAVSRALFSSNVAAGGGTWGGPAGLARGGALALASANAQIVDSEFFSNLASGGGSARNYAGEGFGGAVDNSGEMWILNSRFSSNSVVGGGAIIAGRGSGGGISGRGPLSISKCAFDGNEARGGPGGAQLSCYRGTNGCGGAIYSAFDLRGTNLTLIGNRALGGEAACTSNLTPTPGAVAQGGAICVSTGAAAIVHATLFGNIARGGRSPSYLETNRGPSLGGGIAVLAGTATLYNSILASNASGSNCFGAIIDGGNNISSDGSCPFTQPGSLVNTDPKLGPFADYGGPTPTMPLLVGSPALDAGAPAACASVDQRGITRPYGAGCDIGAFESSPPYTIRGYVRGYLSSNGTTVAAGLVATNVAASGFFALHGFFPGTYTVTPAAPDAVFVLSNQVVNLGPDVINADFQSYRSNAWNVVGLSTNVLHLVLAGAAGQSYQTFDSTNLFQWSFFTNGVIPSSGIVPFDQPADQRARFFRSP